MTSQDSLGLGVSSVQWEVGGVGEWEGLGLKNLRALKLDFMRKMFEGSGGPGMKEVEPWGGRGFGKVLLASCPTHLLGYTTSQTFQTWF